MTKIILAAEQASSNCKGKIESEAQFRASSKNYLSFVKVLGMIHKLLTCDRIILVPTKVPKFTELELANKLNIAPTQLKKLQRSQTSYKQVIRKINPLLVELYCGTKWA